MDEAGGESHYDKQPSEDSDNAESDRQVDPTSGQANEQTNAEGKEPTNAEGKEPRNAEGKAEADLTLPPPMWSPGTASKKKKHKKHCIRGGKLVPCGDRCPEKENYKDDPVMPSPLDANGNPLEGATANVPATEFNVKKVSRKKSRNVGSIPKANDYLAELKYKRHALYEALLEHQANPEKLRHLLESGVSANMEFTEDEVGMKHNLYIGYSPIHVACIEGNALLLEDVIRYGADVDKIGRNGESALYYACVGCKMKLVRGLLRHNADVNITDTNLGGETLLLATVACYDPKTDMACDYLEIARLLILAGADVNQSDKMDISPLYVAVTKADTRMTRLLIDSGAMLLVSDNNEYATKLLMRAIDNDSEENVRLLIAYGCDVNGISQSHGLRHTPLDLAVVKNNLGVILDLLNAGAGEDLNEPLHSAARNKHLVTLLLLIAKGGDVNARNNVDRATLMLTLTRARSEVGVNMLMRLGANPNYDNTLGSTPLWAAVRANYPELVKKFIYCNCALDTTSIQHFIYRPITALQLTFELKFFDMSRWLLYAGALLNPIWLKEGHLSMGLQDEPQMLSWLQKWTLTTRSLRFLCRTVLRRTVGLQLKVLLKDMLYPDSLKHYIALKELDIEVNDSNECLL